MFNEFLWKYLIFFCEKTQTVFWEKKIYSNKNFIQALAPIVGVLVSKIWHHTTSSWSVALFLTVLNKGRRELDYGFINGTLIECTAELQFVICSSVQVILFEIDCAIFYTNLHELFCQFISWTHWVNSGKFMDNCWISCQVMADMEKLYDDLIITNLYLACQETDTADINMYTWILSSSHWHSP